MDQDNFYLPDGQYSEAEMRAIDRHKYYLSQQAGLDVGLEYAIRDWLKHHAARWRRKRLRRDLADQKEEMLKHKWIQSERAGADLGKEALEDWIKYYAAAWRRWKERQ